MLEQQECYGNGSARAAVDYDSGDRIGLGIETKGYYRYADI